MKDTARIMDKRQTCENIPSSSPCRKRKDVLKRVMTDVSNCASDILEDMGVAYLPDDKPPCKRPKVRKQPELWKSSDFVLYKRNKRDLSDTKDHFSDLSDETILEVFKWLPKPVLARCAAVCKRWMRLALDESLWRKLDLGKKHIGPGVLGIVLRRGVVAMKLAMAEVRGPACEEDSVSSKLQYLDLSMAVITVCTLKQVFAACTQLRKLSLEHCTVDDQVCQLLSNNKNLDSLNMSMCNGVTAVGVSDIARACHRLRCWNLAWTHLTAEALSALVDNVAPGLLRINLAGCRSSLSDSHVSRLVERCLLLQELDISDSSRVSGAAVEAIATNLDHLAHLHVSRCYNIPPAAYLMLSRVESLQNLELFCVLTDAALHTLRNSLPHIDINKYIFSTVARPTTRSCRSSIWGLKITD
ncbi:S-phase kinase-associated protein 2-like [Ornithodoros turicata]|uniref:S-phase kinase-associated protein 2-like n=1 Tax=Ornithodoros turicata TaxID=34597 RepID=UPI003139A8B3